MEVGFVRIDDRLIHGQIVTVWSKEYDCNRIIACSDEVAADPLRKQLLLQVQVNNIKTYVIPIKKAIEAYNDTKYRSFKTLFLFTTPRDVLRMIEGGVNIKSVNVGGMCYKTGRMQITGAISLSKEEIEDFKRLNELGVELEIRQVAKDSKIKLMGRLKDLKLI